MKIMSILRKKEVCFFITVKKHILSFSERILLPRVLDQQQLQQILTWLLNNEPSLFFVRSFRFTISSTTISIYPDYIYTQSKVEELTEKCEVQAKKILGHIKATDAYGMALEVHNIIARNVIYVAGDEPELHSIISPLLYKNGVCEGYAKTYKYLMDMLRVPCLVISGHAYNQQEQKEEAHAWNMVQIGSEWCHVDVTFDTTLREGSLLRHDYFGLSNEQILFDHQYDISHYPFANSKSLGYYDKFNLVMHTRQMVKDHVLSGISKGQSDFVVKLPMSSPEIGLETKVSDTMIQALEENGLSYEFTLNYNLKQRVFHIHIGR